MKNAHINVTFLPVTDTDAETLVSLRIDAMRESLESIGRFDPVRARERFLSTFEPQYTRHVDTDGKRAGFVVVKPVDDALQLDHLYIRPQHQGRGIGSAVLKQVFAEADANAQAIRVGALRGSASNRFYQQHGFVQVSESEWDIYYLRPPQAAHNA
jgi:ribosomal protein S18 acetylase RimI-like enzyme